MPIFRFLPYESFCILSEFEPDVVEKKLQHEITFNDKGFDRNADGFFIPDTHFLGFAGKHKFSIKPYVAYRNLFLPKIKGTIEPYNTGSIIQVKMTSSQLAVICMLVYMILTSLACVFVAITAFRIITFKSWLHYKANFNALNLIPFVMLILGQILPIAMFKQESKKSRKILVELFEGEIP